MVVGYHYPITTYSGANVRKKVEISLKKDVNSIYR